MFLVFHPNIHEHVQMVNWMQLFLLLRCTANGSWSCCRKFSAGCRWQQWLIRRCWSFMEGSQTSPTSASSLNWTDTMWECKPALLEKSFLSPVSWISALVFPVCLRSETSQEEKLQFDGDVHWLRRGRRRLVQQQDLPAANLPHLRQAPRNPEQLPEPLPAGLFRPDQVIWGEWAGAEQEEGVHFSLQWVREKHESSCFFWLPQEWGLEGRVETGDGWVPFVYCFDVSSK